MDDPLRAALIKWHAENGDTIRSWIDGSVLVLSSPDGERQLARSLAEALSEVPTCKVLLMFRKIPVDVLLALLESAARHELPADETIRSAVLSELWVRGTNAIIDLSRPGMHWFDTCDVNELPSAAAYAWRVAVYAISVSAMHGTNSASSLKSAVDAESGTSESRWAPWQIAEMRSKLELDIDVDGPPTSDDFRVTCIFLPTPSNRDGALSGLEVALDQERYWLPFHSVLPTASSHMLERDARPFLDTPEFERVFGISFRHFNATWKFLNVVTSLLIPLSGWELGHVWSVKGEQGRRRAEIFYNTCTTGLVLLKNDFLMSAVDEPFFQSFARLTREEFELGIQVLRPGRSPALPQGLLERPAVVYDLGGGWIALDIVRFVSVYRALARIATSAPGTIGELKGRAFENRVATAVSAIPGVEQLQTRKLIRDERRIVTDLDLVFRWRSLAIVIQAKGSLRSGRWFTGNESAVKGRHRDLRNYLECLDDAIRAHYSQIKALFPGSTILGAFGLLCIEDYDPILSSEPIWWVDAAQRLPRTLAPSQLSTVLSSALDVAALIDRPFFVMDRDA